MMAAPLLDFIRIALCAVMLVYSSIMDLRSREVSNWTWVAFAPIGAILDIYETLYLKITDPVLYLIVPVSLSAVLAFAFFYLGLYGGADAKAFITVAILVPYHPHLITPYLGTFSPVYPLTVFTDSAIMAGLFALLLLVRNIAWGLRTKNEMFKGLEKEPLWKKGLVLLSCIKVEAGNLKGPPYEYPAEVIADSGRKLRLMPNTNDDEAATAMFKQLVEEVGLKEVWVSPTLPFLLFISLGFFSSLLFGDFVFWALARTL